MKWPWQKRIALTHERQARVDAWRRLPPCALNRDAAALRWVVVDVESSGLNPFKDRLLSIGAVALRGGRVCLDDGFDVVLRQDTPSAPDNILVHGIGGERQRQGEESASALLRFLEYVGHDPLVAFHASFDRVLIERGLNTTLGVKPDWTWLDLAHLAPALFPGQQAQRESLDDWTALFRIDNADRHNALADALATAELFLALLSRARRQGIASGDALLEQARLQSALAGWRAT